MKIRKKKFKKLIKNIIDKLKKHPNMIPLILLSIGEFLIISTNIVQFKYWNIDFAYYKFDLIKDICSLTYSLIILGYNFTLCWFYLYVFEKAEKPQLPKNTKNIFIYSCHLVGIGLKYLFFFIKVGGLFTILGSLDILFELASDFTLVTIVVALKRLLFKLLIYTILMFAIQKIKKIIKHEIDNFEESKLPLHLEIFFQFIFFIIPLFIWIIYIPNSMQRFSATLKLSSDDRVILYNAVDYAIVSEYEVEGDSIIIYTSRQEKIPTDNLKTYSKTFNKVIRRDN